MYHFFGIIGRSPSPHAEQHRQSINSIRTKFPSRSASFDLIQGQGCTLFGTHIRQARAGMTELFLLGEIYNEQEILKTTQQPVSVEFALLQLYMEQGEAAIGNVNGSFAIILFHHDTGTSKIICDQMGTLQTLYHLGPGYVLVASELKYLFCHPGCPRELDWTASLKRPIPFIVVNAERHQDAWFKDIMLLEPGHVLEYPATGKYAIRPYWDPWSPSGDMTSGSLNAEECTEAYMALLEDAVRIRTSTPDSAFSMFSGGMDSSVIAALAKKQDDIAAYSFATPATIRDGATEMCLRLAEDLGIPNTQVIVPFDDLVTDGDLWIRHIWSMESPFAHKDAIGKMALHAAISMVNPTTRHILSGTGSDQLNGGLVRWFVENAEDGSHDANWDLVMNEIRTEMLKPIIGHQYDTFWGSRDLIRQDYLASMSSGPLATYPWPDFVRGCLHANQFILMWDELRSGAWLNKGVRFPFMDHRFVPFILNVPRAFHSRLFFDKQILRNGSKSLLPEYLTQRPKAPVHKPGEDLRSDMYREILLGKGGRVLDELMDTMNQNNCPVNRDLFVEKVRQLTDTPDLAGWAYLMHLAGLVALSRLPEVNEYDADMQPLIMPHVDVVSHATPHDLDDIRAQLAVSHPDDVLHLPLQFSAGCTLVSDVFTQTHFLVRDGEMSYQIDEDNPEWQIFLRSVDGHRSAHAICAEEDIDIGVIREFLRTSLDEGILSTLKTSVYHGAN